MVAPMNVSVPSSTCGRNASCCALLKRCTSSRNSTVGSPPAAACCACATASRMSLMPACTADSAMKLRVRAFGDQPRQRGLAGARRAPQNHRMRLPGRDRLVQRFARGEHVRLADKLLSLRRAHAVRKRPPVPGSVIAEKRGLQGVAAGHGGCQCGAGEARSALRRADDIDACGWLEAQGIGIDASIALAVLRNPAARSGRGGR